MKTNHNGMPARVRRVEEQFRRWHDSKDEKERIPNRLWQDVLPAGAHSVEGTNRSGTLGIVIPI